jgi:glycerophosphoryl diester phosphodiesterase
MKRFPFIFKKHLTFAKKINAFSINIHRRLVNRKIIEMAHSENFKVFAYTVNRKEEIEKFKDMGIDGIFSDYPDRI